MSTIEYLHVSETDPAQFLELLNGDRIRTHLIQHQHFDEPLLQAWIAEKVQMDAQDGCRVRAVRIGGELAGWCGIQLEDGRYEIAIVIGDRHWGAGLAIFRDMMEWARAFGHESVFIHFLETRPRYRFLERRARRVFQSEIMGSRFTTYQLDVPGALA